MTLTGDDVLDRRRRGQVDDDRLVGSAAHAAEAAAGSDRCGDEMLAQSSGENRISF